MSLSPLPDLYHQLITMGCLSPAQIRTTKDGCHVLTISLAQILCQQGIQTVPDRSGRLLECCRFFDDWYLYAVSGAKNHIYSLFKLREQEHDAGQEILADGDAPGVTVCFIGLQQKILLHCLRHPTLLHRQALADEINRVVSWSRQRHAPEIKAYFIRPEAEAPYLMAELYVRHIASFARQGALPVPEHYEKIFHHAKAPGTGILWQRLIRFIDSLNREASCPVCDHHKLYIRELSRLEKLAILATHTGNTSFHSFAAEVRLHALFLTPIAKIGIKGRSLYASAVRADLSVQGSGFLGWQPYYHPRSRLLKKQEACHPEL